MSTLRFQIQHSNGRQEVVTVEAERALIGSGAHCEIRLPIDQAQVEHVLVQVGSGGVFVQALSFEPSPTIANVPFTQAPLPPDAVLGINQSQLIVQLVGTGAAATNQRTEQKTNPVMVLGALVGIGIAGYMFMFSDEDQAVVAPQEVPELWDSAPASCPQGGVEAKALGDEKRGLADSKRERRMFHVKDGVDAVMLYEAAAACYTKGGDAPAASKATQTAKDLRTEMNDDYRTHRLRLEHARTVGDNETARKEVRLLIEMTSGQQGPYIEYLNQLDRELKQKLGRPS